VLIFADILLLLYSLRFTTRYVNIFRYSSFAFAAILYQALQAHKHAKAFVKDLAFQSKTVIVADTGVHTNAIIRALQAKGLFPGDGYGKAKETQLRFANFPAHSKEQFELLVDTLELIR
jgi:phosphoserine aminotransferase